MTKKIYQTVAERTLNALISQGELTQKQLKKMYKVGSPSKEIHRMRESGVPVYSVVSTDKKGKKIVKYSISVRYDPEVVAAAYRHNPNIFVVDTRG